MSRGQRHERAAVARRLRRRVRYRDEGTQAALDGAHMWALDVARRDFDALRRSRRVFSGDDVPRPVGCNPAVIGSQFQQAARRGEIVHVGYAISRRKEARGRTIKTWRVPHERANP